MVLPPYYFPISEAGMVTYFGKIAESLPQTNLYLYNFPDRTGCDITPDVTVELVKKYENIKGYKDTQAGMDHTRELIRRVKPYGRILKFIRALMITLHTTFSRAETDALQVFPTYFRV